MNKDHIVKNSKEQKLLLNITCSLHNELMKWFICFYLLLSSPISWASETLLFDCQLPIPFFDSQFQQGSHRFLKVFSSGNQFLVKTYPEYQGAITLLKPDELIKVTADLKLGFIYYEWKQKDEISFVSMVALGTRTWGIEKTLSENALLRDPTAQLGDNDKMFCSVPEDIALDDFFSQENN